MRNFGLIGNPVKHSFSPAYFQNKWLQEGIIDCYYSLYQLNDISELPLLLAQNPLIEGFNVTIPYKTSILPYLNHVAPQAKEIQSVNCVRVKRQNNQLNLFGYNTDCFGFEQSLLNAWKDKMPIHALIIGNGGSALAVHYVLKNLGIEVKVVSRRPNCQTLSYKALNNIHLSYFQLIINTTPLGMSPFIDAAPEINYTQINEKHLIYDLVYNPSQTLFLQKCRQQGAETKNGIEMLHLQADKSWDWFNS